MKQTRTCSFRIAVTAILAILAGTCDAADEPARPEKAPSQASGDDAGAGTTAAPTVPFSTRQETIAVRYRRLENALLQLAEYLRKTDPDRSELLIRAIGQSQEKKIPNQMATISSLLSSGQFGDAIDRQGDLVASLQALLELLQSEDRRSELEREKERLQKLANELSRLIGKEKDVRAATERADAFDGLTDRQKGVAQETSQLLDEVNRHDAEQGQTDTSKSSEPRSAESSEEKPAEKQGTEQKGDDSDRSSPPQDAGRTKPPAESETPPAQPDAPSPPSDSPPPSSDSQRRTPGREEIQRAHDRMKQAIEELERRQRDTASEHQDEATRELIEAKEKLEEILRQLREEERGILLTALEARFRRMLAMQQLVYQETRELNAVSDGERTARHQEHARKLSFDENRIGVEADKALALLREEGSSVAFPQTVEEIRSDVRSIAQRLERTDVGALTQTIEQEVITALEEMIQALQKELEKQKDEEKDKPQPFQQPPGGELPLVDALSELKMLRTLQVRINSRTKRLGALFEGEQASDPDVVGQLQELSQRQARIQQATHDLVTGRNQ